MESQLVLNLGAPDHRDRSVPVAELGEVFTRRWIVELILDMSGYTADKDLAALRAVEPACGEGAFLRPVIERLLESARRHRRPLSDLGHCLQAFDLSPDSVERAQKLAASLLIEAGSDFPGAHQLAEAWVQCQDFLLLDQPKGDVDLVLGNPPYIRLENVPPARTAAYRRACPTMRGRSDVYVGFIEKGLRILRDEGVLAFIVADRWMHNQYGSSLRKLIADGFSVDAVMEMHDVDAFEEQVSAYPAIIVIRRGSQGSSVIAHAKQSFAPDDADALRTWVQGRSHELRRSAVTATRLSTWVIDGGLWPSGDPIALALVADLEGRFPTLEDPATGTRVGIGVATGADSVYITSDPSAVEPERLMPLAMSRDTVTGRMVWQGSYLVNPWEDGRLVDLSRFPRLAHYLGQHEERLRGRHVARSRPAAWYRTIDRVDPELQATPKLLIPDLKASIHPVLDDGELYPHHNLYFVASREWPIEVLGGLLLSKVANLLVGTYCVKMRGGCYRFQAQYLRRVRVPALSAVSRRDQRALAAAFRARDVDAATATALRLYGIEEAGRAVIR